MATDNTTDEVDPIEALLESGKFDDSTDVSDLAAALSGAGPTPGTDDVDAGKAADKVGDPDPAQDAAKAVDDDKDDSDAKGKPFDKNDPLYGALSGTRKALKEANRRAEEKDLLHEQEAAKLRQQNEELLARVNAKASGSTAAVQQAADAAGITDDQGNAVDVTTIDVEALREVYDGPVVDAIAALQAQVQKYGAVIKDLTAKNASRERTDEEVRADQVQRDIDAVPVLAEWQAGNPRLWSAAIAVEQELLNDPEWQGKSRVERFQEVARTLGGNAKPAAKQDTTKTADALKAAASRAVPTSLSELPSGTAPGQSETETLEELDVTQLAAKMAGMTKSQQDAFLERMA
jgi:hypothetical protein